VGATDQSRPLSATSITPGPPWATAEVFARLGSTNAEAVRSPRPWRVVVAEAQDAGRGRLGRVWTTPPGSSLAVSTVVPHPSGPLGWLPLTAGLAVAEAIADVTGLEASLKWPNDVLLPTDDERKVAGVLCEWTPEGVVIGTGLNVTTERADLPVETATSLACAGAPDVDRARLLTAYLVRLAQRYAALAADPESVHAAYRAWSSTLGRSVTVLEPGGLRTHGTAVGVDEDGRLILETSAGEYRVAAGDVEQVRPTPEG
jgi:BirA family biotin operon repressor/biotin-[acetyl-CoA-carboxylase] ligase